MISMQLKQYIKNIFDTNSAINFNQTSIMFISLHKCATSYFASYVLKNVSGYEHVDYLNNLYNNVNVLPVIDRKGIIYGPIRIQDCNHPRFSFVESLLIANNFNKIKKIYWIRDPRDILVSMYYSFGFTHGLSKNDEFREYQLKERERIRHQSLDEYVLSEQHLIKQKFSRMHELMSFDKNFKLFKYEDMINNFEKFYSDITKVMPIKNDAKFQIYKDTRPNKHEDITKHKRSGVVGGYKNKLQNKTIKILNEKLQPILDEFDYA